MAELPIDTLAVFIRGRSSQGSQQNSEKIVR
jgi:hypothetical protein